MPEINVRFYRLEDAPLLLEAARESVNEVGPWLPWCHIGLTQKDLQDWIGLQIAAREAGTAFEFAIANTQGAFLGGCGINTINAEHRTANLGYWVRSSAVGKGIAPTAVSTVVQWAFSNTDLERLEIVCAIGNRRSQRVAEKVGAHRDGTFRSRLFLHGRPHDATVYSILRSDHVRKGIQ